MSDEQDSWLGGIGVDVPQSVEATQNSPSSSAAPAQDTPPASNEAPPSEVGPSAAGAPKNANDSSGSPQSGDGQTIELDLTKYPAYTKLKQFAGDREGYFAAIGLTDSSGAIETQAAGTPEDPCANTNRYIALAWAVLSGLALKIPLSGPIPAALAIELALAVAAFIAALLADSDCRKAYEKERAKERGRQEEINRWRQMYEDLRQQHPELKLPPLPQ